MSNHMIRKYIEVNKEEFPNICEILELLLYRIEHLEAEITAQERTMLERTGYFKEGEK